MIIKKVSSLFGAKKLSLCDGSGVAVAVTCLPHPVLGGAGCVVGKRDDAKVGGDSEGVKVGIRNGDVEEPSDDNRGW